MNKVGSMRKWNQLQEETLISVPAEGRSMVQVVNGFGNLDGPPRV